MNILLPSRFTLAAHRERGMAVIVVMALIVLVLILVAGNLRVLSHIGRELKLIEQRQVRRLASATSEVAVTNSASLTNSTSPSGATPITK